MKIILDIAALGNGFYSKRNRAGVFRAIENLAINLQRNKECDLSFSAVHSIVKLLETLHYLNNSDALKNAKVSSTENRLLDIIATRAITMFPGPDRIKFYSLLQGCDLLSEYSCNVVPNDLYNADIFHSTFYPIPRFIRQFPQVKKFLTIYDLIPVLYAKHFNRKILWLYRKILKSVDPDTSIFTISNSTKDDLCEHLKIDASRVFVTPLAASNLFYQCTDPMQIAAVKEKYNIPAGPYILSLSTLEPRKNIDHVIRCFGQLVQEQRIANLNLVLAGSKGWDFKKIFTSLSLFGSLKARIIVTGYIDDRDLAPLYSGALMFVYPSFYEGFGLPPLEAMQCGVPVLTSDTSSLPEVVGDAGILVNPTDRDSLCHAMHEIYNNPSLQNELSKKSLQRASLFSWERCVQQTIVGYKTALK